MPERLRDGIYRLGRDTANTSHKGEPYYEGCGIYTAGFGRRCLCSNPPGKKKKNTEAELLAFNQGCDIAIALSVTRYAAAAAPPVWVLAKKNGRNRTHEVDSSS